jgi:ribosomal protein S18 acetylase RimI-like enzyme
LSDNGEAVVCGLGVLEREYIGLFDLVTDPQRRNQGYGAQLVSGLLHWAKANGARYAYLQVEERNTPARHLYGDKLGYQVLYGYWYRVLNLASG